MFFSLIFYCQVTTIADSNWPLVKALFYLDTSADDDNEDIHSDDTDEDESNTESDHVDASRESSSSTDEDSLRTSRQIEKLRRRKRKRDLVTKQKIREKKRRQKDKLKVSILCSFYDCKLNLKAKENNVCLIL